MAKGFFVGLVMLAVALGLSYGAWKIGRWVHYKFAYEGYIKQDICRYVRPEAVVPGTCGEEE